MTAQCLLINFVGYPGNSFNLVPDNGLANLAACLIERGHNIYVWDCANISFMKSLYPFPYKDDLLSLRTKILDQVESEKIPNSADLRAFTNLEKCIQLYQEQQIHHEGECMADFIKKNNITLVGFKLWSGASFSGALILAKEIRKKNPDVFIVGGGPHAELFKEMTFDITDLFDVLAVGEGENNIVELAEYVSNERSLSEVTNIIYRKNGKAVHTRGSRVDDLNKIPLPCYDESVYPTMCGNEKIKVVLLDESRGCPNSCHFCHHPSKSGQGRRISGCFEFVDKLQALVKKYDFSSFRFAGSNPPGKLRREIALEILNRDMNVSFAGFAHVRSSSVDDFPLLKQAGCKALSYGVESGSEEILNNAMNKQVSISKMEEILCATKQSGIALTVSVIVPAPGETERTKEETFQFLSKIKPDSTFVSFPIMMLGTEWERRRDDFGFHIDDYDAYHRQTMTYRFNSWTPSVLWPPLKGYYLNGKDSKQLMIETGQFSSRLEKAGLPTQLHDMEILIASETEMTAPEFHDAVSAAMNEGDFDRLQDVISTINHSVKRRAQNQTVKEKEIPALAL